MTNPYDPDKSSTPENNSNDGSNGFTAGGGQESQGYEAQGNDAQNSNAQNNNAQYNETQSYNQESYGQQGFGSGQSDYGQQGYNTGGQYLSYDQGQQYNQGMPAYPAGGNAYATNGTGTSNDSFFKALFDLSFTRYVTPSVAKVLYLLLMIVVGLFTLLGLFGVLIGSFSEDGSPILLLIGLPLIVVGAVAMLAMYRVYLEVAVSLIRTSQSVQSIDERQERQLQGNAGGYGTQGNGSYYGG